MPVSATHFTSGPIAAHVTAIWSDLLGLASCPADASFLDLGGDSISAIQIVSRVRAELQADVPLEAMLDGMTIARMVGMVQASHSTAQRQSTNWPAIERQSRDHPLRLSHSQRRMLLVQSFAPGTTSYNVPCAWRFDGLLHTAKLQQALQIVWARHEVFRTSFSLSADRPMQVVQPLGHQLFDLQLNTIDLRTLPPHAREAAAQQHLSRLTSQPFDLLRLPAWHCHLLHLDEQAHILIWVAHHILLDLWANRVLSRELAQVYNQLVLGQPVSLSPIDIDCADHAHWQTSEPAQAQLAQQRHYWLRQLDQLPPSNLPTDHPITSDWYRSAKRVTQALGADLRQRLQQQAARHGHTPFMLLLACLSIMLGRQTRQDDVAVLAPIANRQHPATANLVASLTNTLVMRADLSGDPGVAVLLARIKRMTLDAHANQDLPFDHLVESMPKVNRLHALPLGLQVMLNVVNAPCDGIVFEGLQTSRVLLDRGATQFPLTLLVDLQLTHTLTLEYADQLFEPASAQAFVTHFLQLLRQMLDDPSQPLSALHWLSADTRATLRRWNTTTIESSTQASQRYPSVPAMLREHARANPSALACQFQNQHLSYADLDAQTQTLASHLQDKGIGPGHRVGIHLGRGMAQLVALQAILATGAAYVPLDPRIPHERLWDMAQDADLSLLISFNWRAHPSDTKLVDCLNMADAKWTAPHRSFLAHQSPGPEDPAYVIYTSGTTGKPKGVVVPHRAVLNFLHSMAQAPGLTAHDTLLAVTTLSFDIAVLELLLPLSVGARIVIASDDDALDGHALARLIEQHKVSVMQATPATWRALLDTGWPGRVGFKALVGGEPLSRELAHQLQTRCAEVWNMYGPTETTVWSTCWRVQDPDQGIFIGQAIANTQVRVVDAHGHTCPIGVPGEIVIAGDGVSLGYWQRDDLTSSRFSHDLAQPSRALSAYRTGDLGRWCWNGQLEHLGRLDHQLKVRGHRIEPGDIEAQLMQHDDVLRCVVVAREDTSGDTRLVAYVVPRDTSAMTRLTANWRDFLRARLPAYMVPQHVVLLHALPLLPSGKLDRRALPAPAAQADATAASQNVTLTPWEARLAAVWAPLLKVTTIHPSDKFFDLGGHSLLAMQAISQLAAATSVRISPRRYLFESMAQLALSYERAAHQPEVTTEPPRPSGLRHLFRTN